jgi:hypothetical protein
LTAVTGLVLISLGVAWGPRSGGGLLDDREQQVRKTEIKVPTCTSFKPTDEHEVDISDRSAVAEMKRWSYRQIYWGTSCG